MGTLTLESPHTLLNFALLLQQEKLRPSSENFTDVPSCEKIQEKGRGKLRRFLQVSQGSRVELWAARSWVSKRPLCAWTIGNRESSLGTWHAPSPVHGWFLFVWSSNKLGSFLKHFSEVDKSQSGESPGTLTSWCGLHLRMLTCRMRSAISLLNALSGSAGVRQSFRSQSRWASPAQAWEGLSNSRQLTVLFWEHFSQGRASDLSGG